jgi:putative ABC transport system permease protein
MARRDVGRDRGRSLFVWLMIALPVAAICAGQILLASQDVSPAEFLDLRLGGAQARLTWTGYRFVPDSDAYRHAVAPSDLGTAGNDEPARPVPGWGSAIAAQEAAVADWTGQPALALTVGSAEVVGPGDGVVVLGVDAARPDARQLVQLRSGRLPATTDEVLVTPAWTGLGLPAAGTVQLRGADGVAVTRTIVGTADARLDQVVQLVALPDPAAADRSFLLGGDTAQTWDDAQRLAEYGFATTSRGIAADPPEELPEMGRGNPAFLFGSVGLIGGGGLLEVALLVGPAFAIGAARQRRTLALAASNGADVAHLRRVALGQAVLLGSTASASGVLLGTATGAALWWLLGRDPSQLNGPLDLPALFLVAVLLLGALTAVVAALLPSRGLGRLDLVAALRGSVRSAPVGRHARRWGVLLLAAGLAGTWASVRLNPLNDRWWFLAWFLSVSLAIAGLLLCVPAVLVLLARVAGSAPVVLRIALRDLARQRGRATATVAAILGGSLLLGVVWTMVASIEADTARMYRADMPYGQGELSAMSHSVEGLRATVAAVEPRLRTAALASVAGVAPDGGGEPEQLVALRPGCVAGTELWERVECTSLGNDGRGILAGSLADLTWLFGLDAGQVAALRSGKLLVDTDPGLGLAHDGVNELVDGRLRLAWSDTGRDPRWHTLELPALAVSAALLDRGSSAGHYGALLTTEAAAKHHLALDTGSLRVIDPAGPISPELQARIDAAVGDPDWPLEVERGFEPTPQPVVWATTITLGVLAVVAAAMATILATAEQRPFLATFAAVGASPRLSRRLATTQAAVLALFGTLCGFGLGLLAGVPLALAGTDKGAAGSVLVLPWTVALAFALGVPFAAAVVAAVCVPASPVLTKRA